ncbi:unnamed protein product [Diamesa hyperborea]
MFKNDQKKQSSMKPAPGQTYSDRRLSISGGQLFFGEDQINQDRVREQKLMQKQWLDQQIQERQAFRVNQKKSEQLISDSLFKHDMHSFDVNERRNQNNRQLQREISEYNENMAQQKRANQKRQKQQETADDLAEINRMLAEDMLLKERELKGGEGKGSIMEQNRTKGMSSEQFDKPKIEHEDQVDKDYRMEAELERKLRKEERLRADYEEQNEQMDKERAISRNIRNMNCEIREEVEEQAVEEKTTKDYGKGMDSSQFY